MIPKRIILPGCAILIVLALVPIAKGAPSTYSDNLPGVLSNYVYGGWQGPFGFGGAGNLSPNPGSSGIYMKATYNGYVWALRSSPEFSSIDMTMRFTLATRDNTGADSFAIDLLYHAPTTPAGGLCSGSGEFMCRFVTAQSGLKVYYRVGANLLYITHFDNGVESILSQVSAPDVTVGVPHDARAVYAAGGLTFSLDGVTIVNIATPIVPAGQVGFDVYRMDMIMNTVTLVGTPTLIGGPTHRLSITPTGSFDYLLQENVPIQIAASITDTATGDHVSGASVNVTIVGSSATPVIPPSPMVETAPGTGIYVWTSSLTIQELHLAKGDYLATISASAGGLLAETVIMFHVDPPVTGSTATPSMAMLSILAIITGVAGGATALAVSKLRFTKRASQLSIAVRTSAYRLGHGTKILGSEQ